jgi:hypothetical protein
MHEVIFDEDFVEEVRTPLGQSMRNMASFFLIACS